MEVARNESFGEIGFRYRGAAFYKDHVVTAGAFSQPLSVYTIFTPEFTQYDFNIVNMTGMTSQTFISGGLTPQVRVFSADPMLKLQGVIALGEREAVMDMANLGQYVYIVTTDQKMTVVDVEKLLADVAANPNKRGKDRAGVVAIQMLSGIPYRVAAIGSDKLAVLTRERLLLFDVTDPAFPVQTANIAMPNAVRMVVVSGVFLPDGESHDYAIVSGFEGLSVVDVTNVSEPKIMFTVPMGNATAVTVNPDQSILFVQMDNQIVSIDLLSLVVTGKVNRLNANELRAVGPFVATATRLWGTVGSIEPVKILSGGLVPLWNANPDKSCLPELLSGCVDVRGAVTDGSELALWVLVPEAPVGEQVFISIKKGDGELIGGNEGVVTAMTVVAPAISDGIMGIKGGDHVAVVRYRAPTSWKGGDAVEGTVTVRAMVASMQGGKKDACATKDNKPFCQFSLKRPPILLIHGIWGSGSAGETDPNTGKFKPNPNYTWKEFESLLKKQGYEAIIPVDYSVDGLNAASFDDPKIKEILAKAIDKALKKIRSDNVAGQKVDIVAHSMGGLVVRSFCADKLDFCKESIRKFITIDTPHLGSELADWLLLYQRNRDGVGGFYDQLQMRSLHPDKKFCNERVDAFINGKKTRLYNTLLEVEIPKHPVLPNGAVDSLATGTVAPLTIPPGRWADSSMILNRVRAHALIGRMPDLIPDAVSGIFTEVSKEMWWLWKQALSSCDLTRGDVFGGLGKGSDGVVSGTSQEGRFSGYTTDIGVAVDHLSVTDSEKTVEQVREFLEGKMELFSPLGAP